MKTTTTKNKLRKTDFRLIEIDESYAWREDILKACGGKITTVYLYDASVTTYLCEFTPSYYLTPLYCITEKNINDIETEMQNEFEIGELSNEPIYMHCHQVDKDSVKPNTKQLNGTFATLEEQKELFDSAFEYFRGNHYI